MSSGHPHKGLTEAVVKDLNHLGITSAKQDAIGLAVAVVLANREDILVDLVRTVKEPRAILVPFKLKESHRRPVANPFPTEASKDF